ncbi:MAG: hypothetical protein BGO96_06535 [Micrococcales bacterium 73-15]|uniref:phosphotransferase family protein n=1 Tax=Salana multivorans TaxID=120377 RepID=UPI00095B5F65|nr:aminoglycoside phosphotransferase family protein [Salana multivorans]OJX95962.1 MAG: hypothetical protein BGO96_06535 [Micrococcales bacterium 73-15]
MTHKLDVTPTQIAAVLRPIGVPERIERLTGGMFAAAYRVTLADGGRVVVKATATDPRRLCRYELGIARTEVEVYRTLAGRGLPVPAVVLTDFGHDVVAGDVVVTAHLPGTPWIELDLDEEGAARARRALGGFMADLHRVPAPAFGYPAAESGLRALDWPTAFEAMVEAIVQDATDVGVVLPVDRIRATVRAHRGALRVVTAPAVVHTDLWPANVFLDDDLAIVGVIDTERTVWGDPLLDLIGVDQLGLFDVDGDLLAGDTEAGGVLAQQLATPTGPARFALYRLYFSLILVAEVDVRGYDDAWVPEHRVRVRGLLDATLDRLDELPAAGAGGTGRQGPGEPGPGRVAPVDDGGPGAVLGSGTRP